MATRFRLAAVLLLYVMAGCADLSPRPYRHQVSKAPQECNAKNAATAEQCASVTPELSSNPAYALHIIEFDDEGWLYPAPESADYNLSMGDAHRQIDAAIEDLKSKLETGKVMLITYSHGWKHNAQSSDTDLQRFRELLSDVARMGQEDASDARRQVVGIYVAWRGATFSLLPDHNATFYARKEAARRVADGSARELFARIKSLRTEWHPETLSSQKQQSRSVSDPQLRSIIIGHSFGAHIVFNSLSPFLLEEFAAPLDARNATIAEQNWPSTRLKSAADLVILLNPAFEASAYEPLHRIASRVGASFTRYHAPVLVNVTTSADDATRMWFPVGRFFSTITERPFVSNLQAEAVQKTPMFVDEFVTHRLHAANRSLNGSNCVGWQSDPADKSKESEDQRAARVKSNELILYRDQRRWQEFLSLNEPTDAAWNEKFAFCGGTELEKDVSTGNRRLTPIWNIRTDGQVMAGHNDITGESLRTFLHHIFMSAD